MRIYAAQTLIQELQAVPVVRRQLKVLFRGRCPVNSYHHGWTSILAESMFAPPYMKTSRTLRAISCSDGGKNTAIKIWRFRPWWLYNLLTGTSPSCHLGGEIEPRGIHSYVSGLLGHGLKITPNRRSIDHDPSPETSWNLYQVGIRVQNEDRYISSIYLNSHDL